MKKKLAKRLGLGMGCLLCVLLSAGLLGLLLLLPSGKSAPQAAKTIDIAQRFESGLQNRLSDAMSQISSVRKHYWIAEDASAPEPDGSAFGTAEDPAELAPLLEQAKDVLEGQTLYFSRRTPRFSPAARFTTIMTRPSWPSPGRKRRTIPPSPIPRSKSWTPPSSAGIWPAASLPLAS